MGEFSTAKFSIKFRIPGNCNDSSDDKDVNNGDLDVDKVAAVDVVVVIVAVVGAISINVNIAQRKLMQCSISPEVPGFKTDRVLGFSVIFPQTKSTPSKWQSNSELEILKILSRS